jgi:beta-glucosidase
VAKSLVLLKNDDETLPLSKETPRIFVGGQAADDVGIQCGGWTIEWQGRAGSITPGTTILDGSEAAVGDTTEVSYNRFGNFERITDENDAPIVADVGIAVVGEMPYAEGKGDRADLSLSEADLAMIERLRERSETLVVVIISGRPMIVTEHLESWDAFVAAWLPGTEGNGVTDVLFGDQPFTGELPFTWPRSMDQLPLDFDALATSGDQAPLFPFGYGLE